MNTNTNKGWWWAFSVIVLIVIIAVIVHLRNTSTAPVSQVQNSGDVTSGTDNALVPTEDLSAGSIHAASTGSTGTASAQALSYDRALTYYGSARIQFTATCQAIPNHATWPNNTDIMLDNRSAETRSLHLGTLGDITIKPWGFKIVRLTSSMLPNVITVDCNASQNVAQINIQK